MGADVFVNPDGSFDYDPSVSDQLNALAFGESADDTFTYTIEDINGEIDTATVTVTVAGVNDEPDANETFNTTNEDQFLSVLPIGVLVNDTDPDTSDMPIVSSFDATSAEGATVVVTPDGGFTYDPTAATNLQAIPLNSSAFDSFGYEIDDGNGGTSTSFDVSCKFSDRRKILKTIQRIRSENRMFK